MFLVTGATGNVGAELVRALAGAGEPVRALSRDGDGAGLPAGVEAVAGDLNHPETLSAVLDGVRAVFLLPGYQDAPDFLDRASRAGAERVVLLSGRSVLARDTDNAVSRYMVRAETEARESGLSWTLLRPSAFMANTLEWVPQLRAGDLVHAPFAKVPIASIDPYDIAAVAARALLDKEYEGRALSLSGPEALLPADRVRLLAKALRRKLRFQGQSDGEARAEMSAAMPAEYVDAFFSFYSDGTLDESAVLPTVQSITGRPPRTFAQWAAAHADAFR